MSNLPPNPPPVPRASGIACDTCHHELHWSVKGGCLLCPNCDYPITRKATP